MFVFRQLLRSAPVLPEQYFAASARQAVMPPLALAMFPPAAFGDDIAPADVLLLLGCCCAPAKVVDPSNNAVTAMMEVIFMSASFC
jgi:hypothetical protein